jgi:hypothetical protein
MGNPEVLEWIDGKVDPCDERDRQQRERSPQREAAPDSRLQEARAGMIPV